MSVGGVSMSRSVVVPPQGWSRSSWARTRCIGRRSTQLTVHALLPSRVQDRAWSSTSRHPTRLVRAFTPARSPSPGPPTTGTASVWTTPVSQTKQVQISATTAGRTVTTTLTVQGPGTLTGTVVEQATGTPVAGAKVEVVGTATEATTDASGSFSLSLGPGVVQPSRHEVRARSDHGRPLHGCGGPAHRNGYDRHGPRWRHHRNRLLLSLGRYPVQVRCVGDGGWHAVRGHD